MAAPVFSQIMRYALHRYGIPTSPGGGTTGGTPMSVPFPLVSPPKTAAVSAPSTTTTTTTIVASHGKLPERRDRPRGSLIVPLDRLLGEVDVVETYGDPARTEVTAIAFDSRRVEPGALFCCLPGDIHDGHDYAVEARGAGRPPSWSNATWPWT